MQAFERLAHQKVMIVGDVMIDQYLYGQVHRISPEAPVPVVLHEEEDDRLGGAANVALNIRRMGATPVVCTVIGQDAQGAQLCTLFEKEDITTDYIVQSPSRQTTIKTRVLSRGQQLLRYDREQTNDIDATQTQALLEAIDRALEKENIDIIIFQDYNKGILTAELIEAVQTRAQRQQILTVTDPKKDNFFQYKGVTLFKPNMREVNDSLHLGLAEKNLTPAELHTAAKKIQQALENKITLVTLGGKGMFWSNGEEAEWIPAFERQVADVCGAGDTVISIIALGLAAQWPMSDVVKLANLAGGQVCEHVGVVPVNRVQLQEEFDRYMQSH